MGSVADLALGAGGRSRVSLMRSASGPGLAQIPIEAAIAFSILILAVELVREKPHFSYGEIPLAAFGTANAPWPRSSLEEGRFLG